MGISIGFVGSSVRGGTFYVSPDGDDQWSGTLLAPNREKTDGPFASVNKARNAIRKLKVQGPLEAPVNVLISN